LKVSTNVKISSNVLKISEGGISPSPQIWFTNPLGVATQLEKQSLGGLGTYTFPKRTGGKRQRRNPD